MAFDIFAKIGEIKGESVDAKHKDEIEVLSFSWGVAHPASFTPGGGAGAKATFQDLSIVHHIDKASPLLMQACATGTHLKEATITHRKASKGHEYLIVKMNDIIITAVAHTGDTSQRASETVSLAFAKVDLEYIPQKPDGTPDIGIHFKYDLQANKVG
jgi:type VI secretion system secreted protein Hcp